MPKFAQTHCSQCGRTFGPGSHGYSHCEDHEARSAREVWWSGLSVKGDPMYLTDSFRAFESGYLAGVKAERERSET